MNRFLLLIILCLGALGMNAARVENLRCEYVVDPLGVDTPLPRLSWVMTSERRADFQRAYRILVVSSLEKLATDDADCWDTGKINSDQSIQIDYQGKPLLSGKTYFWKVAICDGQGKASAWSEPDCWSMGLLSAEAWHGAQWIAYQRNEQWQQDWTAPYCLDITEFIKEGENELKIEIVNTWVNRVIGDMKLPVEERQRWAPHLPYNAESPLQPSCLFGPVVIKSINYES